MYCTLGSGTCLYTGYQMLGMMYWCTVHLVVVHVSTQVTKCLAWCTDVLYTWYWYMSLHRLTNACRDVVPWRSHHINWSSRKPSFLCGTFYGFHKMNAVVYWTVGWTARRLTILCTTVPGATCAAVIGSNVAASCWGTSFIYPKDIFNTTKEDVYGIWMGWDNPE